MINRKCSRCKISKPQIDFYKAKKTGYFFSWCKTCHANYCSSKETRPSRKQINRLNKENIVTSRWREIRLRAREGSNVKGYSEIRVLMSKEDFFLQMNNSKLALLYDNWKKSEFEYRLTPSLDRIDPRGHYQLNNIRWVTLAENAKFARKGGRAKPIKQMSLQGEYIATFNSAVEAGRQVVGRKNSETNICSCAVGRIKQAYGFVWRRED